MNPNTELNELLKTSGAVLVREKNHLVYRLPSGESFVRPKTSSDWREGRNSLATLQTLIDKGDDSMIQTRISEPVRELLKSLGATSAGTDAYRLPNGRIFTANPARHGDRQANEAQLARLRRLMVEPAPNATVAPPPPEPPPPPPPAIELPTLAMRIKERIAEERAQQDILLGRAAVHEKTANMLEKMLEFADTDGFEAVLADLALPAPPPEPPPPPPPPQIVTERIAVTQELVYLATQTFGAQSFKLDDIVDTMTQGKEIDPAEKVRIRSSVASLSVALLEKGQLRKTVLGIGKRPAVYQAVRYNGRAAEAADAATV